ncbi:LssY C-terminal domain-containing protein [Pelagibius marinus]|uniref:LssY C-terminal domain-containing protein n=1 Tax=Pelagibius marinus TaxID=2762760 RepID=UPI00187322FA|nr:LssY C-terminal domain-containing protein [Pelagibius marinus]
MAAARGVPAGRLPRILRWQAALLALCLLAACASFTPPQAPQDIGFQARAATRAEDGLTISAAALGPEESRAAFGLPLIERGIQPVWLKVTNSRDAAITLLPLFFDALYYTPGEAAFINHGWFSGATNAEIDRLFNERALPLRVEAGQTAEGFIFGTPDLGQKALNLIYVGDGRSFRSTFVVPVPGLAKQPVDLGSLYEPDEVRNLTTAAELRAALETLPCCVTDKAGEVEADPLNFVVLAEESLGRAALIAGGWDPTEDVTGSSALKTLGSFLFGSAYRYSPVSDLYVFGRKQDAAFQIAREDIHERNHLRVWLAPLTFRGTPVWIGAISRDIGVIRSGFGTTHKIDPNVDDERWYLAQSLARAQALKRFAYVDGGAVSTPESPRSSLEERNVFYSDGRRIVLQLSPTPVPLDKIERFRWHTAE